MGIREVAYRLDCSVSAIQKRMQRGSMIPMPCAGPPWKWRESHVDHYINTLSLDCDTERARMIPAPCTATWAVEMAGKLS